MLKANPKISMRRDKMGFIAPRMKREQLSMLPKMLKSGKPGGKSGNRNSEGNTLKTALIIVAVNTVLTLEVFYVLGRVIFTCYLHVKLSKADRLGLIEQSDFTEEDVNLGRKTVEYLAAVVKHPEKGYARGGICARRLHRSASLMIAPAFTVVPENQEEQELAMQWYRIVMWGLFEELPEPLGRQQSQPAVLRPKRATKSRTVAVRQTEPTAAMPNPAKSAPASPEENTKVSPSVTHLSPASSSGRFAPVPVSAISLGTNTQALDENDEAELVIIEAGEPTVNNPTAEEEAEMQEASLSSPEEESVASHVDKWQSRPRD